MPAAPCTSHGRLTTAEGILRICAFFVCSVRSCANGGWQHVMEMYTSMELLVYRWKSGEGYHVLFYGSYYCFCTMGCPCSLFIVMALQKFRHVASALGCVVVMLSFQNLVASGYLNNFLPPILAAALSLPSRLRPVNPTVPPYCAFLYLRNASRK